MSTSNGKRARLRRAISRLTLEGFKSHRDAQPVEFAPLTIFAGANSSGKSSLMQALLLLKQTGDAAYDPGPLKLDGPNVYFTANSELLWRRPGAGQTRVFRVSVESPEGAGVALDFERRRAGFRVARAEYTNGKRRLRLQRGWSKTQILDANPDLPFLAIESQMSVEPNRFRLRLDAFSYGGDTDHWATDTAGDWLPELLARMAHLPGFRGSPARRYPTTGRGPAFAGTFERYAAGIVSHWTEHRDGRLGELASALAELGLTWKVDARRVDAASVAVRVGRTPKGRRGWSKDLINIADAGFGLSQVFPVVVALVGAEPGTMVFIEQPEIHLHPDAQVALADLLASAVGRGVQVVVETHSDLLLVALQRSIAAEGGLPAEAVVAHWFERDEDGATQIRSARPDAAGAFGEWPVDFADVAARLDAEYSDAAFARLPVSGG